MKKIGAFEPWFFLFFGVFHLHRIWGLIDRNSYADFWLSILESKGALYYFLMAVLLTLCVLGVGVFFKNRRNNDWWRWVYLLGGSYLLFDLLATAAGWAFWHELLRMMFDVSSPYWNVIWGGFVLLGGFAFGLGVRLLLERRQNKG
ncbi:MAG: hypothetical protein HDT37_09580 [Clostridiales bacterium]|nr:hypothetical protein [Clostridiales bacterium]